MTTIPTTIPASDLAIALEGATGQVRIWLLQPPAAGGSQPPGREAL